MVSTPVRPSRASAARFGITPVLHVRVEQLPVGTVQADEEDGTFLARGAGDLRDNRRVSGSGGGDRIRTAGGEPGGPGGGRCGRSRGGYIEEPGFKGSSPTQPLGSPVTTGS